jgi:hypothetical protein
MSIEKKEIEGSCSIELKFVGDGRIFLNYWDIFHGNDVTVELVDGSLYDDEEEITLDEFLSRIKKAIEPILYKQ